MPATTTYQNIFLALFLSLILTLFIGVLYVLYPLVSSILFAYPDSSVTSAVRVSKSDLKILLIEPILFVLIFDLLHKRRARRS